MRDLAKWAGDAPGAVEGAVIEETTCPKCGGKMVSRKSSYGVFWGCADFPRCDGTRDSFGRTKQEREADEDWGPGEPPQRPRWRQ